MTTKPKCLETRDRGGLRWRRYRTADGRTITTYELPTAVLSNVTSAARLRDRMERWSRAQKAAERRSLVQHLLAEGWKPIAVANEVGLSTRAVEKIRERNR